MGTNGVISNMEYSILTKENFETAMADLMNEDKWKKRQKDEAQRNIVASEVITRCWKLYHDENTPDDIKGLVYGLAMSTTFNGIPICSKEIRDKLEDWL
jgi:hypothetical protein